MFLETDRMILRDFTVSDFEDFYEIFSDSEVMKHLEPPFNRNGARRFLVEFCIERKPKGAYAAVLKETNKVIGYILFKPGDEPEIYEIGFILNKSYWRRGYAFEICRCLISYGFIEMNLHKIFASTEDTEKAVPLMKKLGFQLEGIQKKHTKTIEGNWCDFYLYAILAEDF